MTYVATNFTNYTNCSLQDDKKIRVICEIRVKL